MATHRIMPAGQLDAKEDGNYEAALQALSTLITRRKRADGSNWGDAFALMDEYIKILELEEPLQKLSVIHLAGTKGKGSTGALAESILRAAGFRTGLFTSPHLVDIRERFRFDGQEVTQGVFLEHFWWCFHRLQGSCSSSGEEGGVPMPPYFRFLTLLGLRLFTSQKVDVALLEVGIGGRYDATNVVKAPAVCGVTSLGYDHMELLGNTLAEIAGEKAGIFKAGVPAVTSPQPQEAMQALQARARELQIELGVAAPIDTALQQQRVRLGLAGDHQRVNAALAVELCRRWLHRTDHAQLAAQVDQELAAGVLPAAFVAGLSSARWPGRAQILHDTSVTAPATATATAGALEAPMTGSATPAPATAAAAAAAAAAVTHTTVAPPAVVSQPPSLGAGGGGGALSFYLDGAHTPESMEVCAAWFCQALREEEEAEEDACRAQQQPALEDARERKQVVLFNCMPERDPETLLSPLLLLLAKHGIKLQRALVVPGLSSYTSVGPYKSPAAAATAVDLSWQRSIQRTWESLELKRMHPPAGGANAPAAVATEPPSAVSVPGPIPTPEALLWADSLAVPPLQEPQQQQQQQQHASLRANSASLSLLFPNGAWDAAGSPNSACFVGPTSLVMPSLPAALELLRRCARGHPPVRLQVLVTGSLHLVGDVLRLVR
eukprot:jgi/Mesen1/6980/ME000362S06109